VEPKDTRTAAPTRRSIRTGIVLLLAGIVGTVIVVFGTAAWLEVRQSTLEAAEARLAGGAGGLSASVSGSGEQFLQAARALASEELVADFLRDPSSEGEAALRALVVERLATVDAAVELRDPEGRRVFTSDTLVPPEGADVGVPRSEAGAAGQGWVGPLLPFPDFGGTGAVFHAASAGVGPTEARLGSLTVWRRLDTSEEARRAVQELIDPAAEVFLVSADETVWTDFARSVAAPDSTLFLMVSAEGPPTPWQVVVSLPRSTVMAGPTAMLRWLFLFGAILLLVAVVVGRFLIGRMTAGLSTLAEAAERIRDGDYRVRVPDGRGDEVGVLARTFNSMAEHLDEARRGLEGKVEELSEREAEAREIRERLEHVVSSSRAVLFSHPGAGHEGLRWISDNVRWLLARDPADATAPGWWEAQVHPADRARFREAVAQLGQEESVVAEYRFHHGDGSYRWIRDERRVRSDGPGDAAGAPIDVVGVVTDVTRRHELEAARARAEGANRAKSEFLSRMSHELRTPLTAVLGFGELLRDASLDEDAEEHVTQILGSASHLLTLIDEILDITGIEAGRMRLEPEPVEAGAVVAEALAMVRFTAKERGVTLEAPSASSPVWVQADRQRLRQVLLNLLTNGIRYNRPGGSVKVTAHGVDGGPADESGGGPRVWIVVEDTGPGITPAQLPRLFVPFDRLDMEGLVPDGTGLGLPLSRALAEAMGGSLGVQSEPGTGSRFWIELAAAPAPQGEEEASDLVSAAPDPSGSPASPPGTPTSPGTSPRGVTGTVLLVEDHPANLQLIERILRRRPSVRLHTADRGAEGIRLAAEARPDLVLLDLNLPDLNGDEVLSALRADPGLADTRVVIISGDASPVQARRLLDLGAHEYLFKPFGVADLLAVVDPTPPAS
jgi:signal transduction histidine kinase